MKTIYLIAIMLISKFAFTQEINSTKIKNEELDSLFIIEVEQREEIDKILHAEPLFIDLIRDLGARKGEREWNIGIGITDNVKYDSYNTLVEYEWAPINRLGLEIELPFTFYYKSIKIDSNIIVPSNKLDGIKTAIQWSFFVSERIKTSMAIGYINEVKLIPFNQYSKTALIDGNIYNPFLIIAKRWKNNFHTLVYTGPTVEQKFKQNSLKLSYQINTNFHYMISGTRNFVGVELNKNIQANDFDMTIRPQMRLGISENLLVGIVAGIPIKRETQRFSAFLRLIYEPPHKKKHH